MGPLHTFPAETFTVAVVIEPVIDRLLKYQPGSSAMLVIALVAMLDMENRLDLVICWLLVEVSVGCQCFVIVSVGAVGTAVRSCKRQRSGDPGWANSG